MKKNIQEKLLVIATCLITCFIVSCKESADDEKQNLSANDSINNATADSIAIVTNNNISEVSIDSLPAEKINSLSELKRRLNKKASYFVIKTNRDTAIQCKDGTLLSIPANAFLNTSSPGTIVNEVKISVKEFYKISDMMIAGLTTTSNDQLLETGGMINIKVTSKDNNDSCILKPGKNILIALTNSDQTNDDRMQLFNGVHDSTHINWQAREGFGSFAQSWRQGSDNFSRSLFSLNNWLVFPDGILKTKPVLVNSNPEDFKAEVKMSLRELMHHAAVFTKKANAYIDTLGNLHCYKSGDQNQRLTFNEIYSPTTYKDKMVNVAVDVNLGYKANVNQEYYQKLFKMRRGNPDSLVTVIATLNPAIKITGIEKVKVSSKYVCTVKEFEKKQQKRALLVQEYEKRLNQFLLDSENKLVNSESKATTNLQNAQSYLLLSTPKLGWINCDRFYNAPTKVDYLVKLKEPASLLIVFNSLKSIIPSDKNGIFRGVPLDEKITIVGLKTENGKLMMAYHETTVTQQPFEKLNFENVTVKEYKHRLEKLNRM